MKAIMTIRQMDEDGNTVGILKEIVTVFDLHDANDAAQEFGNSIFESILPVLRKAYQDTHSRACLGGGGKVTDTQYGNTICPVCNGIAQVDGNKIEPHNVKVILPDPPYPMPAFYMIIAIRDDEEDEG